MKENQVKKQRYVRPLIECVGIAQDSHLLAGSELGPVTGGHHSAGDDETMNAKRFQWLDEEETPSGEAQSNLWED